MSVQGCGAPSGDRRGDCCKSEPTEPVGVSRKYVRLSMKKHPPDKNGQCPTCQVRVDPL